MFSRLRVDICLQPIVFIKRLARNAKLTRDGTQYSKRTPPSFLAYHLTAISLAAAIHTARMLIDGSALLKRKAHLHRSQAAAGL